MLFDFSTRFSYLSLYFLPKLKIYPDRCLTKYLMLRKEICEVLAADVTARNIVIFRARFFRVKFLSRFNVTKKSVTLFASQVKIYFGCGCLLLLT